MPQNLTNPLKADLDAGGYNVTNATEVDANVLMANDRVIVNGAEVLAGAADPSAGLTADVGSIYLRRHADTAGVAHGELWFKFGIADTDWQRVV